MHPTKQTYVAPKLSVLTGPTIQESDKTQVSEKLKEQVRRHMPDRSKAKAFIRETAAFFKAEAIAAALNSKTARDFASVDSICERMMK